MVAGTRANGPPADRSPHATVVLDKARSAGPGARCGGPGTSPRTRPPVITRTAYGMTACQVWQTCGPTFRAGPSRPPAFNQDGRARDVREHDRDRPQGPRRASRSRSGASSRSGFSIASTPLHRPLPSIRRLSRELGVSVTTVALAYEALKQDGFVEGRNRSGFYVNQDVLTDPGHALKPDAPVIVPPPEKIDYREFFRERSFNLKRVVKPADCPRSLPLPVRLRSHRPVALPHRELARVRARFGQRHRGRELGHGLFRHRRPRC